MIVSARQHFVRRRVRIHRARRDAIDQLFHLHRRHPRFDLAHQARAQDRAQLRFGAFAPARFNRRRMRPEPIDAVDQIVEPLSGRCLGPNDRRTPLPFCIGMKAEQRLDFGHGPIGAVAIGFVHDEHVGDLHHARLERLHLVAHARDEHDEPRRQRCGRSRLRPAPRRRSRSPRNPFRPRRARAPRRSSRAPGRPDAPASPCCG